MICNIELIGDEKIENWLSVNGRLISKISENMDTPVFAGICASGRLPVIVVDNNSFCMGYIPQSEQEYYSLITSSDPRKRLLFTCNVDLLEKLLNMSIRVNAFDCIRKFD